MLVEISGQASGQAGRGKARAGGKPGQGQGNATLGGQGQGAGRLAGRLGQAGRLAGRDCFAWQSVLFRDTLE